MSGSNLFARLRGEDESTKALVRIGSGSRSADSPGTHAAVTPAEGLEDGKGSFEPASRTARESASRSISADGIKEAGLSAESSTTRSFSIPRRRSQSVETFRRLASDTREYKDLIRQLKQSTLDPNSPQGYTFKQVSLVHNPTLLKLYQEKRQEMRGQGYTPAELVETYGFVRCRSVKQARELCNDGLKVGWQQVTVLGDPSMGVYVSRYMDYACKSPPSVDSPAYLLVVQFLKGRVKSVSEQTDATMLEPTPNFDCHCSKVQLPVELGSLAYSQVFHSTQYYLYEFEEIDMASRPRQCCPYALVEIGYSGSHALTHATMGTISQSNSHPSGDNVLSDPRQRRFTGFPGQARLLSSTEENGIVAWRGPLNNKMKYLAHVKVLSFCGLGLPGDIGNAINIKNKIGFSKLQTLLPSPIFTKGLPVPTRSASEQHGNFWYFYCRLEVVKDPEGHFEKLKQFFSERMWAGVVEVEQLMKLYLLPTSSLTVKLGLTRPNQPLMLHGLVVWRRPIPDAAKTLPVSAKAEDVGTGGKAVLAGQSPVVSVDSLSKVVTALKSPDAVVGEMLPQTSDLSLAPKVLKTGVGNRGEDLGSMNTGQLLLSDVKHVEHSLPVSTVIDSRYAMSTAAPKTAPVMPQLSPVSSAVPPAVKASPIMPQSLPVPSVLSPPPTTVAPTIPQTLPVSSVLPPPLAVSAPVVPQMLPVSSILSPTSMTAPPIAYTSVTTSMAVSNVSAQSAHGFGGGEPTEIMSAAKATNAVSTALRDPRRVRPATTPDKPPVPFADISQSLADVNGTGGWAVTSGSTMTHLPIPSSAVTAGSHRSGNEVEPVWQVPSKVKPPSTSAMVQHYMSEAQSKLSQVQAGLQQQMRAGDQYRSTTMFVPRSVQQPHALPNAQDARKLIREETFDDAWHDLEEMLDKTKDEGNVVGASVEVGSDSKNLVLLRIEHSYARLCEDDQKLEAISPAGSGGACVTTLDERDCEVLLQSNDASQRAQSSGGSSQMDISPSVSDRDSTSKMDVPPEIARLQREWEQLTSMKATSLPLTPVAVPPPPLPPVPVGVAQLVRSSALPLETRPLIGKLSAVVRGQALKKVDAKSEQKEQPILSDISSDESSGEHKGSHSKHTSGGRSTKRRASQRSNKFYMLNERSSSSDSSPYSGSRRHRRVVRHSSPSSDEDVYHSKQSRSQRSRRSPHHHRHHRTSTRRRHRSSSDDTRRTHRTRRRSPSPVHRRRHDTNRPTRHRSRSPNHHSRHSSRRSSSSDNSYYHLDQDTDDDRRPSKRSAKTHSSPKRLSSPSWRGQFMSALETSVAGVNKSSLGPAPSRWDTNEEEPAPASPSVQTPVSSSWVNALATQQLTSEQWQAAVANATLMPNTVGPPWAPVAFTPPPCIPPTGNVAGANGFLQSSTDPVNPAVSSGNVSHACAPLVSYSSPGTPEMGRSDSEVSCHQSQPFAGALDLSKDHQRKQLVGWDHRDFLSVSHMKRDRQASDDSSDSAVGASPGCESCISSLKMTNISDDRSHSHSPSRRLRSPLRRHSSPSPPISSRDRRGKERTSNTPPEHSSSRKLHRMRKRERHRSEASSSDEDIRKTKRHFSRQQPLSYDGESKDGKTSMKVKSEPEGGESLSHLTSLLPQLAELLTNGLTNTIVELEKSGVLSRATIQQLKGESLSGGGASAVDSVGWKTTEAESEILAQLALLEIQLGNIQSLISTQSSAS